MTIINPSSGAAPTPTPVPPPPLPSADYARPLLGNSDQPEPGGANGIELTTTGPQFGFEVRPAEEGSATEVEAFASETVTLQSGHAADRFSVEVEPYRIDKDDTGTRVRVFNATAEVRTEALGQEVKLRTGFGLDWYHPSGRGTIEVPMPTGGKIAMRVGANREFTGFESALLGLNRQTGSDGSVTWQIRSPIFGLELVTRRLP